MYDALQSSAHLIETVQHESYPSTFPHQDKAFITARLSVETTNGEIMPPEDYLASDQSIKTIVLNIGNATPVVTLQNALADEFAKTSSQAIYSVPRIRSGEIKPDEWMISGGMMLYAPDDSLVLFERTERMGGKPDGAVIAWPKAFNNPMGRCDDVPSRVCLKEGAQEIMILSKLPENLWTYTPHMFVWGREVGIPLAEEKALQAKAVQNLSTSDKPFGVTDQTSLIAAHPHPEYADRLVNVETHMNGALRDRFKAVAAFSKAERTLELAIPAKLDGPNGLAFISREPFGRATVKLTPEQLAAAHYGWAMGAFGQVHDAQQGKTVNLGGILPILQCGVLGHRQAVSRPEEVSIPKDWTLNRVRAAGLAVVI